MASINLSQSIPQLKEDLQVNQYTHTQLTCALDEECQNEKRKGATKVLTSAIRKANPKRKRVDTRKRLGDRHKDKKRSGDRHKDKGDRHTNRLKNRLGDASLRF